MEAGVLPVKRLDRAKSRLGELYGAAERAEIAAAMLDDALALCDSADWLRWWVVTDDSGVAGLAGERGFEVVGDTGIGLNEALSEAIEAVSLAGAESVTIVPSDAPLAYVEDLRDLSDTGATSDVVVVPSEGDGGTNGLYLRPPGLITPQFGPGSLKAHVDAVARLGLRCSILNLPRLGLDIDTPDDIDSYLARPAYGESRTRAVLERLLASKR